jgi:glutathione S-transferase
LLAKEGFRIHRAIMPENLLLDERSAYDSAIYRQGSVILKVYGVKASRAVRTLWLCRELGLSVDNVPVSFADPATKTPEFLAVNPSAKIPAIDDDGFHLAESMAINIYLAKKHGSTLMPKDLQGEARVLQWSFWVMSEIEKPLLQAMFQRMKEPVDAVVAKYFRDRNPLNPEVERAALEALEKPLAYLNNHLADREYLLGKDFTLADLNVASVLAWLLAARVDLTAVPKLQSWLGRCLARPARN